MKEGKKIRNSDKSLKNLMKISKKAINSNKTLK